MDHLALMRKSWKLIEKILSGEKKIESRWYMAKFTPWNRINNGDVVYFKDAGEPVTAKAEVEKIIQFDNYSEEELKRILNEYGSGIAFVNSLDKVYLWAKKKKYCILIFLKNPQKVKPFTIDKKGFGNACAWITIDDINKIKTSPK